MFRQTIVLACCGALLLNVSGCGENHNSSNSTDKGYAPSVESAAVAPRSTPSGSAAKTTMPEASIAADSMTVASESAPASRSRDLEAPAAVEEKPFVPNNGRQSVILTAGSFDDVAKFDDYLSFLRRNQHQAQQCRLPIPSNAQQTVIAVTDSEGKPLGDVRCVVQPSGKTVLDQCTGSDGRVMLLSDGTNRHTQQSQPLHLQVYVDGQADAVVDEYREANCSWSVILQETQSTLPTQLDLALVVDTTGSMGDELEYLKTEIVNIVASVSRMFPDIDQRFSLITYRDNGDEYVCRTFDFTGSLSDFRRNLDAQTAQGGGDFPEAMDVALQSAEQLTWRKTNTARVLFLVGDAPPHSDKNAQEIAAIYGLSQQGVRIFPVGASGVEKKAEVILRTASLLSMGQYLFLTDHSGVGNPHATPDVPSFAVERLDRLMLRMIVSELAGKRLVAEEVIAIEHGERYSYVAPKLCEPPSQQSAMLSRCFTTPKSTLTIVKEWLGSHVLATIVAVVSCAIVFERLADFMNVVDVT